MNETISTILSRRSIRNYRPEPLPREILEQVLQAGLYAPSARNRQPWHLTMVTSPAAIERLTAEVRAATLRMPDNPYTAMVQREQYRVNFGAPALLIVSADPSAAGTAQADCALVLGNVFLAAHSLGVGSCWVNQLGILSDEPGFRSVLDSFGVPSQNRIYGCAALGYAEGAHPTAPERRSNTVNYVEE